MHDPNGDPFDLHPSPETLPGWACTALQEPAVSRPAARLAIMELVRQEPAPRRPLMRLARRLPSLRAPRWPRRGTLSPFGATAIAALFAGMLSLQSLRATVDGRLPGADSTATFVQASAHALGDTVVPVGAGPLGAFDGRIASSSLADTLLRDTLRIVEFVLRGAGVQSAGVVGDFNAWRPGVTPMTRAADGRWLARVLVPRDMVRFAYVVQDRTPRGAGDATDGRRPPTMTRVRLDSI